MSDCCNMLKDVQILDFALIDAALYLDNHTKDKDAIEFFNYHQKLSKAAKAEFEGKYGPLQFDSQKDIRYWQWTKGPWPWEE